MITAVVAVAVAASGMQGAEQAVPGETATAEE